MRDPSILLSSIVVLAARSAMVVVVLTGCALAPGMNMGALPVANENNSPLPPVDIAARADLYSINPLVIKRLEEEKQMNDAQQAKARALPVLDVVNYQYRIGPQDILNVIVWDHPELNDPNMLNATSNPGGTLVSVGSGTGPPSGRIVNSDGSFFYPLIGDVQAAGKTTQELRRLLQTKLAKSIRNPQVDVTVLHYRSQRVFVTGEVKTPSTIPVTDSPLTLNEVLGATGGLTNTADLSSVTVTRAKKKFIVDLYALLYQGNLAQNVLLRHGDIVNIPENRPNKVFVLGEVVKPASMIIPRGSYSLTEVLTDAGGLDQVTANAAQVYVIRASQKEDRPQIFHLNAAAPDALMLADRFQLNSRDVVYVDTAAVTRWNRVLSQILPSAQLLQSGRSLAN